MKKAKRKQMRKHQVNMEKAIVSAAWRRIWVKAGVVK